MSRSQINESKVEYVAFEEIGLFPRSFSRVLDRFLKQLFSDVDNLVIQEYRFYRYLFYTTLKTLFILFFVPFLVNFFAKNYIVKPITEYFWNNNHPEIFLNSYEQKRAFAELEKFEEKIYFETLVESHSLQHVTLNVGNMHTPSQQTNDDMSLTPDKRNPFSYPFYPEGQKGVPQGNNTLQSNSSQHMHGATLQTSSVVSIENNQKEDDHMSFYTFKMKNKASFAAYQEKTVELATSYNNHSIHAITNFFADLLSLFTLLYLLITLEIQINITKSFLLEVFFGLDDSKKSLLILLITDLLVGYHSSNLWELFFEFIFNHYGIPESQTGIFLLVATLPVLLDVLFKYLIFRHLNRSSPATVATYQAIIE
jgi:hypothetical protein